MNKQTLQILGTLILISGLAVGSIGTYRIVTNLHLSDAEVLKSARRALSTDEEIPAQAPLRENVELQIWESALKMTNQDRGERRREGAVFLLSGIIAVIWGMTVLLNSRSTPREP